MRKTFYFIFYFIINLVCIYITANGVNNKTEENIDHVDNVDDINENIHKYLEKVNYKIPKNEPKKIINQWEEKIEKFRPENLLTVEIKKGDYCNFYVDIENVPSLLSIAFYINEEDSKIDFSVSNPKKKTIQKIKAKNREFLDLNVTLAGTYKFTLDNQRFKYNKMVTLAINTGENSPTKILSKEHLQNLFDKLSLVDSKMKEAKFSQKMLIRKNESHFKVILSHNKKIMKYSLIEVLIMILIFFFQFWYLKKLIIQV